MVLLPKKSFLPWLILFVLITLLPLALSRFFVYAYDFPKFIFLFFLVSLLLISLGLRPHKFFNFHLPLTLCFFFLCFLTSTLFSKDILASLVGTYGYYTDSLLLFFLLTVVFGTTSTFSHQERWLLMVASVAVATLVAMVGIKEYWQLTQHWQFLNQRIGATIGQPNRLAFYLAAVLPLSVSIIFRVGNKTKILFGLSAWLIFVVFLLTFSRTTYLSLGLLLLIISFICLRQKSSSIPKIITRVNHDPILIGLASGLMLLLFLLIGPLIWQRITAIQFKKTPQESGYLRLLEWQGAFQVWRASPLTRKLIGYGPNTLLYYYPQYRSIAWNQSPEWWQRTVKIRNQYLNILNDMGIIGLMSFLFLFLQPLRILLSKQTASLPKAAAASLIFMGINGLFYYFTLPIWLLFFLLQALLTQNMALVIKSNHVARLIRISCLGIGIIGLFMSLTSAYTDLLATKGDMASLQKAVQLNPAEVIYQQRLSRKFRTQAEAFAKEKRLEAAKTSFDTALFWSQKALSLHPLDLNLLLTHQWNLYRAGALIDKNYHQQGLILAQKITELTPNDPRSFDQLGLVYLDLGQFELANSQFQQAINLKNDYVGAYLHLGETFKQQGRLDEARKMYLKAQKLDPNFSLSQQELDKLEEIRLQDY